MRAMWESCWEPSALWNNCKAFLALVPSCSTFLTECHVSLSLIRYQYKPTYSVLKFMKIINSSTTPFRKAKSILQGCLNLSFIFWSWCFQEGSTFCRLVLLTVILVSSILCPFSGLFVHCCSVFVLHFPKITCKSNTIAYSVRAFLWIFNWLDLS